MAENVARMGKGEMCTVSLAEKPEGRKDHLKDIGVDGMIILKWIFWKSDRRHRLY